VDPEQRLDVTERTERRLREFEVAAETADLVVVHDRGCAGRRILAEHMRNALRSRRFRVLALSYPSTTGNPRRTEHGEPWADERVTGTRQGRDFWLELSFYLQSLDRYRVHVSDSDTMPVTWHRVTAFSEDRLRTDDGLTLALESVRRFAVTYPNHVLTTLVPDDSQPLPPGARFQPEGEPPDPEPLWESQLEAGRFHVRIDFSASGPKPHDPNHFTTTFTNFGARRVRVLRFGAYRKTRQGYVLHTITGTLFTGEDFVSWYAAPADGWIAPGQSVSDPANYGAPSTLWAWFCETEDGDRFIASGTPSEARK
jgi:hypothetical protein